jgi:hypothetical protein
MQLADVAFGQGQVVEIKILNSSVLIRERKLNESGLSGPVTLWRYE